MNDDKQAEKAFDFLADSTKQLITLSSGITALTVTFAKDVFVDIPKWVTAYLVYAWFIYVLSIVCGIWALYAMVGTLGRGLGTKASLMNTNMRIPVALQQILFIAATGLIVYFGSKALH